MPLRSLFASLMFLVALLGRSADSAAQEKSKPGPPSAGDKPSRTEVITPKRNATFDKEGKAQVRKQGGNPRTVDDRLIFDGSQDGNRQVDPQIAVGKDHVLHGTNGGIIIYDKKGNYVRGVPQREFNDGIDPKLFYDVHNGMYCFDLWFYYDKEKQKPVNISASETADPLGAWNTYPVPAPAGVDGGGIGHSRRWIGYSFPGGKEQTFVLKTAEVKAGKPATVYHFSGNLGEPVQGQDPVDDLFFFSLNAREFVITRVTAAPDGSPVIASVTRKPHGLTDVQFPPPSPQKGTTIKTASGDRNPKRVVLQSEHLWFSHAVSIDRRSAVQWHQVKLDGTIVQTGMLKHATNSYIQTTLAVNKHNDVLVGYQETGPEMFISPRCAIRRADDPRGRLRAPISLGEGKGATDGLSWGDYSGSVVDGENLTDLWTIQSITSDKGKGHTVISRIRVR